MPPDPPSNQDPEGAAAQPEAAAGALAALEAFRAVAREEAASELQDLGFSRAAGETEWSGALVLPDSAGTVPARVRLPENFPDALPVVLVDRASLPRRVAHVGKSGEVCVVPQASGVSWDADRPRDLVREALTRAARELARGLRGESDTDLNAEFLAYWEPTDKNETVFIGRPEGPARPLVRARVGGAGFLARERVLLADSEADAKAWAAKLGASAASEGRAFFVPLRTAFLPPDFGVALSAREARALVAAHAAPADAAALAQFLRDAPLPATVVLALPPAVTGAGRTLAAVRFEPAVGDAGKAAKRGFRPGHVPA